MQLLSDQGPVPDVSNTQLFMFMYPRIRQEAEAAFLIDKQYGVGGQRGGDQTEGAAGGYFEGSPQSHGREG